MRVDSVKLLYFAAAVAVGYLLTQAWSSYQEKKQEQKAVAEADSKPAPASVTAPFDVQYARANAKSVLYREPPKNGDNHPQNLMPPEVFFDAHREQIDALREKASHAPPGEGPSAESVEQLHDQGRMVW